MSKVLKTTRKWADKSAASLFAQSCTQFDEGGIATAATQRCGSLLYKRRKQYAITATALCVAMSLCATENRTDEAVTLASGPWYYEATGWQAGQYEWKELGKNIAEITLNWQNDWSGYDRLSVDMVNEGNGGDSLNLFIRSPETKQETPARFIISR